MSKHSFKVNERADDDEPLLEEEEEAGNALNALNALLQSDSLHQRGRDFQLKKTEKARGLQQKFSRWASTDGGLGAAGGDDDAVR